MAEQKIYTKEDIPENGFVLTQKQKNSILELQDQFYTAVDNEHAQGVANALDGFATKSLLFLERNLGAMISAEDTQSAKKLFEILTSRIEVSLLDSHYRSGFSTMKEMYNTYHSIATGRSIETEDRQRQNFEEHADKFLDDFNKIWDHFEEWFDDDLYISHKQWRRKKNLGALAEFLSHDDDQDDSLDTLEEQLEALGDDELKKLSTFSIREYVNIQRSEGAFEKAKFLLFRFEEKFQLNHEDAYKFHEDLAHIHLEKGELQHSLTHFEKGLEHAAHYGDWDSRYTRCLSHILILQRRLKLPVSEELSARLKKKAPQFEPSHRRLLAQYLFLERVDEIDAIHVDKIEPFVEELVCLEGINLPPLEHIRLLFWIYEVVTSDDSMFSDGIAIRKKLLSSVTEIAEKYGRWGHLERAYSTLADFEEGDGNIFLLEEYKDKLKNIDSQYERLNGVIATGQNAHREKDKDSLKKINLYYQLCVKRNWTFALEGLKSIEFFFGKDGDYDALDQYNGPYYKLLALLNYTNERKFWYVYGRGREERFAQFKEKVLNAVREDGGLLAEARALDVLTAKRMRRFVPKELKSLEGTEQMLSDFDRLVEVNVLMNAMKFATSARSTKALFLLEIGKKSDAETLFKEVIEEFKELEPRNALFAYETFARASKLYLEKPEEVLAKIDDLVKLDEFKENDTMEILVLKSAALMVLRGVEGAKEAENTLRPLFQYIGQKQWIHQRNLSKYNHLAAMYLTCLSLQDDTENLTSALSEMTGNGRLDVEFVANQLAKNRLEISCENTREPIEIVNELGNHFLRQGMVELAYCFKNQAMSRFNKNENFESARKIGEELLPILLEHQDAYRLQNIIFQWQDHTSLLELLESYDAVNLLHDFPNNFDKARLFQTLAIRLNYDVVWFRKTLEVSVEIENRQQRGFCLRKIWNSTNDEADFMAMKTFYDEAPPGRDFHTLLRSFLKHEWDVNVDLILPEIKRFYTSIIHQGDSKGMSHRTCLSAVFFLFKRFGEENVKWRKDVIELHQRCQESLDQNSPLTYDFVKTNLSFRLKHAEWLCDTPAWEVRSRQIHESLRSVVDAAIKLQEQNPGYLYFKIYREVIDLFKLAERSPFRLFRDHPLKSITTTLENLLSDIKKEMHGRILLFQIEMLILSREREGLREKIDLLDTKKKDVKGFVPPYEYLNLVSALIAYGEMDSEHAAHATKSMLSVTSSRMFFIIPKEDQNTLVEIIQRFMIKLPPMDDYVPEEFNNRFQRIIDDKKRAHPTELISLYHKGKKMWTHRNLQQYGTPEAKIQFVEMSMERIRETDFSDAMKVGFCDHLFRRILKHHSEMNKETYKTTCLEEIQRTKKRLLNSFKNQKLLDYAIAAETSEEIENEYFLTAQGMIRSRINSIYLNLSNSPDIGQVKRAQDKLAIFYPWLKQSYDMKKGQFAHSTPHISEWFEFNFAVLAETNGHANIAKDVYYAIRERHSESPVAAYALYRYACLSREGEGTNPSPFLHQAIIDSEYHNTKSLWRLLLCWYHIKETTSMVGAQALANAAIESDVVQIIVDLECRFNGSEILIGGERISVSKDHNPSDLTNQLEHYNKNRKYGNDVLLLGRNAEGELKSMHSFQYFSDIYFRSPPSQAQEASGRRDVHEEE